MRVWQAFSQRFDSRWFQIAFLSALLSLGLAQRDFAIQATQIAACFAAALATQALWQWGLKLPTRNTWGGYLSALVSSLGICILVRAENAWVHPLLAGIAMSSKYIIRAGPIHCKSHVLNPANLAAVLAWGWVPGAWLSPAQWGFGTTVALLILALGAAVTGRIVRWDISFGFLLTWLLLLFGRCVVLDYEWAMALAIVQQQISNGAVLLFAFFMISDPMTTPQHHRLRVVFAVGVAVAAFVWQYVFYKPHGLIVMLCAASLLVPLLNWRWPRQRFAWA